jgi:signal peptidase I
MKKALIKKLLLSGKIFFGLILALVIVVSVFPLLPPFKNYYHSRTVLTGSMEPKIPKGSVVINQWLDQKNLKVGDVITYQHPADQKIVYITHRVVKIDKTGLLWRFETKGDANPAPDFGSVTQASIEGKVILTIPLIGYLIEFFKTPVGFILLVALPLLIFIVRQARDVLKMWKKRKVPPAPKALVAILLAFSFLAARISFVTYASFTSGQATITGVTLSTAASFPGDVVINEVYYDVKSPEKGIEGNNEWVEVYNPTDGAIDISGWKIEDNQGSSYQRTIPSSSPIPSHGYAVITPDVLTWNYWSIPDGAIKIVLGNSIGNGLSNDGDRVVLKTPGGTEVDAMSYGIDTYAFSPACSDVATGHSLSRKPAGYDTNTATDWIDTYSGSTPPGPNPGTNPHNEDGSLVVPTITPEPSVTPTVTPTPTSTVTPELSSEPSATSSATTVESTSTPSPTPETSPTPTPTAEPSLTPEPSPSSSSTLDSTPTPTPIPTTEPTSVPSTTPTPSPDPQSTSTASSEPSPSPSPQPSSTPAPTSEPIPTLTPTPSPTSEL